MFDKDAKYLRGIDANQVDILSLYTGEENNYFDNYKALDRLKEEINILLSVYTGVAGLSFIGMMVSPVTTLGLGALLSATVSLEYFYRIARIHDTLKMLLEYFGDDGIKIIPRVRTKNAIIDLLVRMPDKRIFVLMLRGKENTVVMWREDRQQFFVRKKGRGSQKSDSLNRTIQKLNTVLDLKKAKSPIMGTTNAERNAPTIKTIVLAPGAEIAESNSRELLPELWADFGQSEALKICNPSITYVVEYDNLIKFMLLPKK